MSDLIERQAAIDAIMGEYPEVHYPDWYAHIIKQLPPAKPERKTGHWILYDKRFPWSKDYKCSECGNYINIPI